MTAGRERDDLLTLAPRLPFAAAWVALGVACWAIAAGTLVWPRAVASDAQRLEPAADTLRR